MIVLNISYLVRSAEGHTRRVRGSPSLGWRRPSDVPGLVTHRGCGFRRSVLTIGVIALLSASDNPGSLNDSRNR